MYGYVILFVCWFSGLSQCWRIPVFEPNRGGNLWSGVQSQGQKDWYENKPTDTVIFTVLRVVCWWNNKYVCRWDCCSEKAEDGEGEGRLSHHLFKRNQYNSESSTPKHCHSQGERTWKILSYYLIFLLLAVYQGNLIIYSFSPLYQEIVVGSNMDKIYIVMNYVEHDLKSLMETMKQPFLPGDERYYWALVHFFV